MPITISEIARIVEVSQATVSRVLNSPHLVKRETREKVLTAFEKHDYVYNAIAGGLTKKRSATLGLIIPTITNPVFAIFTKGIQDAAKNRGYSILLGNTDYSYDSELKLVTLFHEKRVDGMIFTGAPGNEKSIEFMKRLKIPYLITWEKIADKSTYFVTFDNVKTGRVVTDYLISLGHRRIGMVAGRFSETGRAYKRWLGYKQSLERHAIPYDEKLVIENEYTVIAGKEAMARLLGIPDSPTAVFCGNDILAFGAMAAVREAGCRVGTDVSIVGFDDLEASEVTDPPLTTVRVPGYKMGTLGAETLIGLIEGEIKDPHQYVLETSLIIRESTGNPRSAIGL
jgi:DNA-binding LacI/PurR family transcriptional regulator